MVGFAPLPTVFLSVGLFISPIEILDNAEKKPSEDEQHSGDKDASEDQYI